MRINKKTLETQVMFELLFSEYIKIPKENDFGDWYFFECDNQQYLVQFISSIADIRNLCLPKKYICLFIEKETFNIYTISEGFVKKDNYLKTKINIKSQVFNLVHEELDNVPVKLTEIGLKAISRRIECFLFLKQFEPLQIRIMYLNDKLYFLFAESKTSDKNNRCSINKNLIKKDFITVHFILNNKENLFLNKENILRTNINKEDIRVYNDLYYINKDKYKKIKS